MILSGPEISRAITKGDIVIKPYDPNRLNPNSYNLRLGPRLLYYPKGTVMDAQKPEPAVLDLSGGGKYLEPGLLYLAETIEYTESHSYVPMLEGRSSIGRIGLFVHVTAGFGDTGFCGRWTLELIPTYRTFVEAGMEICQIYYHTVQGEIVAYQGRYQNQKGVTESRLW